MKWKLQQKISSVLTNLSVTDSRKTFYVVFVDQILLLSKTEADKSEFAGIL